MLGKDKKEIDKTLKSKLLLRKKSKLVVEGMSGPEADRRENIKLLLIPSIIYLSKDNKKKTNIHCYTLDEKNN